MMPALIVTAVGVALLGVSYRTLPPIPRPRWRDIGPAVFMFGAILTVIGTLALVVPA